MRALGLENLTSRVYPTMTVKRKPHHDLVAVKAKFARTNSLEITRSAIEGARTLGYSLEGVVDAVQALEPEDFIKSETAHSPKNSKIWHDTYNLPWDDRWLFLKFAGEALIDVTLVSFKEVGNG
jgi:motility quorum-sensing regulator/GCU-specific mRNA interferase toxin